MSKYKSGDKVYLECEVITKYMRNNTYALKYKNWRGDECISTDFVRDDVLHSTDEAYNKGLNDAWKLARKIILPSLMGGYTADEIKNIFDKNTYILVMSDFTPQEALAKVKPYEEKRNEIRVGDVVIKKGCIESIVTKIDGHIVYRLFRDGSCASCTNKKDLKKTGKHFYSIDEFMRS